MIVFIDEAFLISLKSLFDFERLRNHRGNHAQELCRAIEISLLFVRSICANNSNRFTIYQNRHADETHFLAVSAFIYRSQAIEEERFLAGLRYDNRFSALHYPANYTFTDLVGHPSRLIEIQAKRGLYTDFLALRIQQHDKALDHAMMTAKSL